MQHIRRDAIDNIPLDCLQKLKETQINFMGGVILTTVSVISKSKTDVIQRQLTDTREMRQTNEMDFHVSEFWFYGLDFCLPQVVERNTPCKIDATGGCSLYDDSMIAISTPTLFGILNGKLLGFVDT